MNENELFTELESRGFELENLTYETHILIANIIEIQRDYLIKQLHIQRVSQQREQLIAFLEMNNWFSLEDRKNAEGVVDCYLKAINCW